MSNLKREKANSCLHTNQFFFFFNILSLQEREHDSEDEDEDKYADDIDMPGQNFDSKRRITVRNLRIREDTAKVRNMSANTGLFSALSYCFTLTVVRLLDLSVVDHVLLPQTSNELLL